jgi:ComF family protein
MTFRMRMPQLLRDVVDFCYPHRCARCEVATEKPFLCPTCDGELSDLANKPACKLCAMPLGSVGASCPYCEDEGPALFDRIVAMGMFRDPLRHLIYAVKYHRRWTLAEQLADRLLKQEPAKGILSDVDCLVAVPLHRFRQISRGFNQAEVLARRLGAKSKGNKPVKRPAVRLRDTGSQIQLHSRAKREENLKDAFGLVNGQCIEGRHVLLIDDVTTTGATLRSLARTLRPAKPASLSALVLAVADPQGQDFQVY